MISLEFVENEIKNILRDKESRRSAKAKSTLENSLYESIDEAEKNIFKLQKEINANLTEEVQKKLDSYKIYKNELQQVLEEQEKNTEDLNNEALEFAVEFLEDELKGIRRDKKVSKFIMKENSIKVNQEFIKEYKHFLQKLSEI